jgi:hypothetical protein
MVWYGVACVWRCTELTETEFDAGGDPVNGVFIPGRISYHGTVSAAQKALIQELWAHASTQEVVKTSTDAMGANHKVFWVNNFLRPVWVCASFSPPFLLGYAMDHMF